MHYRTRAIESKLHELTRKFGAVLVTGPRQAGKTSLLQHVTNDLFGDAAARTVSFDSPSEIDAFRRDPDLFFANHPDVRFLEECSTFPRFSRS